MSELYHYGRSKRDGAPVGSGRYPLGSGKNDKQWLAGVPLARYTNTKEKTIRPGSYFFIDHARNVDSSMYYTFFTNNKLTGKYKNKVYKTTIKNTSPILVRSGADTVSDIVSKIKDKRVDASYLTLKDSGFFEPWASLTKRAELTADDKYINDRRVLINAIHKYVYKNRNKLVEEYKKNGYDVVVDPEDFTDLFNLPLMVTNSDKFKFIHSKKVKKGE